MKTRIELEKQSKVLDRTFVGASVITIIVAGTQLVGNILAGLVEKGRWVASWEKLSPTLQNYMSNVHDNYLTYISFTLAIYLLMYLFYFNGKASIKKKIEDAGTVTEITFVTPDQSQKLNYELQQRYEQLESAEAKEDTENVNIDRETSGDSK
ncbi:hypothetical protein ABGV42_00190 [Paenibacillus pabuli]|uniref:hypothetical protein n=1 Tax=Paenibacillus pabuli TaxID=1472 RepID=UPI0032423185